jgi:hypothetical protein
MFSFFKSSKKSPIVSPDSHSDTSSLKGNDDFVVLGPSQPPAPNPLYPSSQLPQQPSPSHSGQFNRQMSMNYSYTQNVPFQLNPVLNSRTSEDFFDYKLREIRQMMNRTNINDYDFKLERSILNSN